MKNIERTSVPRWVTVRLGEDFNWWLESTSDSPVPPGFERGLLDPRQVTHLATAFGEYTSHGLRPERYERAFWLFRMESEIEEGRLRLALDEGETFREGSEVFAMPAFDAEEDGPFVDLLDAVAEARIRKLNATRNFVRQCTQEEMYEELDALDGDRYFSTDMRHCFDELNEILEWSPAEWDDSSKP